MLASGIDANGYCIIIGAIVMGIVQILQIVLSYMRELRTVARTNVVIKEVKSLQSTTVEQNQKLDEVKSNIEDVKKNSNGLTDRLISKTEAEAHARGLREGKTTAAAAQMRDATMHN